jgi:uridine kinase
MNLEQKSKQHMFHLNALAKAVPHHDDLPFNVIILRQTNQLKAMTTIIRDRDTDPQDFIFYLERTSALVIERY